MEEQRMNSTPNAPSASSPFLTRQELQHRWRCSKRFIQTFKEIPSTKLGRTTLYHLADVMAYEQKQAHNTNLPAVNEAITPLAGELSGIRASLEALQNARLHHETMFQQVLHQIEGLRSAVLELRNSMGSSSITPAASRYDPASPSGEHQKEQDAMLGTFLRFIDHLPQESNDTP